MKTSLDHLPEKKRRDLERVVRTLFEEFEDTIAIATQSWKKQGRILKVVLYGSHARGDWVEDPVGGYFSDYDILVVVSDERLADTEYWHRADERLMRDYAITQRLSAEVSFIVHSMTDVNRQLHSGRPFFIDIVRDGILLYDCHEQDFSKSQRLSPVQHLAEAQKHFDYWSEQAGSAMLGAKFYVEIGNLRDASFLYHQAAERFCICLLLTFRLYAPKSHNLKFLRGQSEIVLPELMQVWPRDSKFSRRCFELLKQAYVNARYSADFEAQPAELEWIGERIDLMERVVCKACEAHLKMLTHAVADDAETSQE